MSREAREGEQVEAAAWKSTNLHGRKSDGALSSHRKPTQEERRIPISSWDSCAGEKLKDDWVAEQVRKRKTEGHGTKPGSHR